MPDLAMHILDLVYNSIRAKATWIHIAIIDSMLEDLISIVIEDNGCGMDEVTALKVQSPFYTTRTTRDVGLGIPLFKEAALMCQGKFNLTSTLGKGTRIEASFQKTHWDTPPMGDLAETMATLIQANEAITYEFTYTKDNHTFYLNTKEIKTILDGVPITEPDVIIWLKQYIKEGLA